MKRLLVLLLFVISTSSAYAGIISVNFALLPSNNVLTTTDVIAHYDVTTSNGSSTKSLQIPKWANAVLIALMTREA